MFDITTIKSVEDARKALKNGELSRETAQYIAQAVVLKKENLLNKPGMTCKDKMNMYKSIKFLVNNKMDTTENLKKLDAINYTMDYIEIGGVKRARKNLKAKSDGKSIFQHGDETYFKFDALEKQNALLEKRRMEIPGKDHFVKSLEALPGEFKENKFYAGGNILGTLLDMPMTHVCNDKGDLSYKDEKFGCVGSSSEFCSEAKTSFAWRFIFSADKGIVHRDDKKSTLPMRAVYK